MLVICFNSCFLNKNEFNIFTSKNETQNKSFLNSTHNSQQCNEHICVKRTLYFCGFAKKMKMVRVEKNGIVVLCIRYKEDFTKGAETPYSYVKPLFGFFITQEHSCVKDSFFHFCILLGISFLTDLFFSRSFNITNYSNSRNLSIYKRILVLQESPSYGL